MSKPPVSLWHTLSRSWDALFALCDASARAARSALAACLAPRRRKRRRSDESTVQVGSNRWNAAWS